MSLHPFTVFVLRLAFGLLILSVAGYVVDWGMVFGALLAIKPEWFLLAFVSAAIGSIVIPAVITRQTLRAGDLKLTLRELIKINFAMRFYVLTLPHVVTVGIRWQRYRGANKGKGWQIAALILFERVVQFTTLVLFAFVFLLMVRSRLPEVLWFLLPLSAVFTVVGFGVLLSFLSRRIFVLAQSVSIFVTKFSPRLVASRIERLTSAISDYQKLTNHRVAFVLLWSVLSNLLSIASAYFVVQGMSIDIGFADIGWMRSAIFLLTVLPITVGGIGVREVGFATLLYLHEVDKSVAVAFPLVLLGIQLLLGLVGALLEAGRTIALRKEMES